MAKSRTLVAIAEMDSERASADKLDSYFAHKSSKYLQCYYWAPFHCLGDTIELKIGGDTITILFYPALHVSIIQRLKHNMS